MEEEEQPPVERSLQPRTVQACQRCRSLKTRCLPSEQPATCQRCFGSKRDCVWADAPRKAKRVRGPSRISKVEQKIDGLVATLVNPDSSRLSPPPALSDPPLGNHTGPSLGTVSARNPARFPGSWLPVPLSFESRNPSTEDDTELDERSLEKPRMIHSFGDDEPTLTRPPGSLFNTNAPNEPPIEDDLIKRLLSSGEADTLINEYRTMSESFPFVPISPKLCAQDLNATKPILLLAILTVASCKDHGLQRALDERYRTQLANRTIIRPRRNLSLFQSTIVYLSWYHFVFSHETEQIFPLLQLAIGLALDLGLHQELKRPFTMMKFPNYQEPSAEDQRERQRAFLGCYYLSSAISVALKKPNLLKYSDYMGKCISRLKYDLEFALDNTIDRLISLRRIDDQIHDTYDAEDALDLAINDSRIAMNLRFMESQLQEWERECNTGNISRALELSHAFTDMQLHAIGLRPAPPDAQKLQFGKNRAQLSALLCTLEAGKQFLDSLLAIPAAEYHLLPFPEWMRLPHVVVTISRLCIPSDLHSIVQWDAKAAQDRVRLDLYLESLCHRMQGLSTHDKVKQPHMDFWRAMHMIMDLTRKWYCRKIRENKEPPPQTIPNEFAVSDREQYGSRKIWPGRNKELSSQTTPNDLSAPETLQDYNQANGGISEISDFYSSTIPSMDPSAAIPGVANGGASSGFGFMQAMGFDMDQFLDMGIWGTESYESMGFGAGNLGSW